jgi:hypothetical protein
MRSRRSRPTTTFLDTQFDTPVGFFSLLALVHRRSPDITFATRDKRDLRQLWQPMSLAAFFRSAYDRRCEYAFTGRAAEQDDGQPPFPLSRCRAIAKTSPCLRPPPPCQSATRKRDRHCPRNDFIGRLGRPSTPRDGCSRHRCQSGQTVVGRTARRAVGWRLPRCLRARPAGHRERPSLPFTRYSGSATASAHTSSSSCTASPG